MAEKAKPDPNAELHRTLNNACRKWGAREIRLCYLPKASRDRWIAEAPDRPSPCDREDTRRHKEHQRGYIVAWQHLII
jgi:hypothetical protein